MGKSLLNPRLKDPHWEPKFPFDLVVAYEDRATRNRALHLYDHLAQRLVDDYDFKCAWWKFEHLADPTLREHAIDDAANANMVVVSLRARKELPAAYKNWIDSWITSRDHHTSAFVALIAADEPHADATGLVTSLQGAARLGHMDFFTHYFEFGEASRDLTAEQLRQRASTLTPVLEGILNRSVPAPRWGINE